MIEVTINAPTRYVMPEGDEVKANHGLYEIARKLLARGYLEDETLEARWYWGTPSFKPLTLGWLSQWAVYEDDNGIRRRRYVPHPFSAETSPVRSDGSLAGQAGAEANM